MQGVIETVNLRKKNASPSFDNYNTKLSTESIVKLKRMEIYIMQRMCCCGKFVKLINKLPRKLFPCTLVVLETF